jgi:hypothetical protein
MSRGRNTILHKGWIGKTKNGKCRAEVLFEYTLNQTGNKKYYHVKLTNNNDKTETIWCYNEIGIPDGYSSTGEENPEYFLVSTDYVELPKGVWVLFDNFSIPLEVLDNEDIESTYAREIVERAPQGSQLIWCTLPELKGIK